MVFVIVMVSAYVYARRTSGTLNQRWSGYRIKNITLDNVITEAYQGRSLVTVSTDAAYNYSPINFTGNDTYGGNLTEQTYVLQHNVPTTDITSTINNVIHAKMILMEYMP